ncbi:MAG: RNA polymerase sigma factor [Myxococcales bacterium]|jgi:RNA polymerase sigma-70 factor (ECF subfamily)|nr:RNA polymerase sigma factor [Myxococcales bacterium]
MPSTIAISSATAIPSTAALFSFEQLLQAEIPTMRRVAGWIARDADAADDLLQDTMLLALRFRDSYKENVNMRAWLTRIMKNRHISILRRKNLEYRILETEKNDALPVLSMSQAALQTRARDGGVVPDIGFSDTVLHAMNNLRDEYRDVVILCDIDGLSYAEAAASLSCPLGTVMSRLHRGRRELRKHLVSRTALSEAA